MSRVTHVCKRKGWKGNHVADTHTAGDPSFILHQTIKLMSSSTATVEEGGQEEREREREIDS